MWIAAPLHVRVQTKVLSRGVEQKHHTRTGVKRDRITQLAPSAALLAFFCGRRGERSGKALGTGGGGGIGTGKYPAEWGRGPDGSLHDLASLQYVVSRFPRPWPRGNPSQQYTVALFLFGMLRNEMLTKIPSIRGLNSIYYPVRWNILSQWLGC